MPVLGRQWCSGSSDSRYVCDSSESSESSERSRPGHHHRDWGDGTLRTSPSDHTPPPPARALSFEAVPPARRRLARSTPPTLLHLTESFSNRGKASPTPATHVPSPHTPSAVADAPTRSPRKPDRAHRGEHAEGPAHDGENPAVPHLGHRQPPALLEQPPGHARAGDRADEPAT